MIAFWTGSDVRVQSFSLMIDDHSVTVHVDDQVRQPLVPFPICASVFISLGTNAPVLVYSPISSSSAYYIPTSFFVKHPHLSYAQQIVNIQ